jgi:hypothetical protein
MLTIEEAPMDDASSPDDEPCSPPEPPNDADYERFLLEEGLDLLASFRAILDIDIRRQFLTMVKTIAAATP